MRTWQVELLVAAIVLFGVALLAGGSWVQLVGAGAVALSFAHAQVADRLAEAEADRRGNELLWVPAENRRNNRQEFTPRLAHCHAWAVRYLVGKELLWLVYFVALGAWSALAGVGLFLLYPLWRRGWRR